MATALWAHQKSILMVFFMTMPFNTPQTLSADEVYAVTAYILHLNGIIDEDVTLNARRLRRIEMPNADGFIMAYPSITEE